MHLFSLGLEEFTLRTLVVSVDEQSAINATTERGNLLKEAEEATIKNGGIVIRFGGLYTRNRGAHNFWLKGGKSEFPSNPNGLINLIHYDDAAGSVIAALIKKPKESRLLLAADGIPISRLNICKAAIKCQDYKDCQVPNFSGDPAIVDGKKYSNKLLVETLDWQPRFKSFEHFMITVISRLYKPRLFSHTFNPAAYATIRLIHVFFRWPPGAL